jgi:hypothetical protein
VTARCAPRRPPNTRRLPDGSFKRHRVRRGTPRPARSRLRATGRWVPRGGALAEPSEGRPCAGGNRCHEDRPRSGGLSLRPLTKKGACSRLAQSPSASRPNPEGSVSHAPRLRPATAPQAAHRLRELSRISRVPSLPSAREPAGRPAAAGDRRDGPGRPSRPATAPARGRAGRSRSARPVAGPRSRWSLPTRSSPRTSPYGRAQMSRRRPRPAECRADRGM